VISSHVIVSGEVDVFKEMPNGEKVHLSRLSQGASSSENRLC